MPRVLLTSLGTGEYEPIVYRWVDGGDWAEETNLAPVALASFLRPVRVVALVTEQARAKWGEAFAAQLADRGLPPPDLLDIDLGETEHEIARVLEKILEQIQGPVALSLDITHGFRSHPFIYQAALQFLSGFGQVDLTGFYYAKYTGATGLFVDLSPLLFVIEGAYAIRAFRLGGDLMPAVDVLQRRIRHLLQHGPVDEDRTVLAELEQMAEGLMQVAVSFGSGLTQYVGEQVAALDLAGRAAEKQPAGLLGLDRILSHLRTDLIPWAFADRAGGKDELALSQAEIDRQLRLIERYVATGRLATAILVAREFIVTRVLLAQGVTDLWQNEKRRSEVGRELNRLAQLENRPWLGTIWQTVREQRNVFAHNGIGQPLPDHRDIAEIVRQLREHVGDDRHWQIDTVLQGALTNEIWLLSALGNLPGHLYGALRHNPDCQRLIVFSTNRYVAQVPAILQAAGRAALPYETVVLRDMFHDYSAVDSVGTVTQLVKGVRKVKVNLTGGTPLTQYLLEKIATVAQETGVDVVRVAQVDRRPFRHQQSDPFVLGRQHRLDP